MWLPLPLYSSAGDRVRCRCRLSWRRAASRTTCGCRYPCIRRLVTVCVVGADWVGDGPLPVQHVAAVTLVFVGWWPCALSVQIELVTGRFPYNMWLPLPLYLSAGDRVRCRCRLSWRRAASRTTCGCHYPCIRQLVTVCVVGADWAGDGPLPVQHVADAVWAAEASRGGWPPEARPRTVQSRLWRLHRTDVSRQHAPHTRGPLH